MTSETKNRLGLPWKAGTGSEAVIYDSTGHRRIHEPEDHEARDFVDLNGHEDAAYIVKAVNNHEALVRALMVAAADLDAAAETISLGEASPLNFIVRSNAQKIRHLLSEIDV